MGTPYYVNVTMTVATAATDQHAIISIRNPAGSRPISLLQVSYFSTTAPGAGMGFITRRYTAGNPGTASSSVTPGAAHHQRGINAPDSAFVIDLGTFSVQPTLATGDLPPCWVAAAVVASGVVIPVPRGIEIPANTGIVICNRAAIAFQPGEWEFLVEEL